MKKNKLFDLLFLTYKQYMSFNNREKIRLIIIALLILVAFSIPFGHIYAQKIHAIILFLWIFVVKLDDIKYLFKNKIVITLFLFIVAHYLTLFWSDHIKEGLYETRNLWRFIFIPIVVYLTVIKKENIKYIVFAFIVSMFINEIISYLIYFDLYHTEFSKTRAYPVGFINHIQYSVLVAFSAILILYQAKRLKSILQKSIYILFFITMTTNLVISSGRTGYVVFFLSLILLLFVYYKFTWKNFLQILVFPTVVFYIGYKLDAKVQARVNASFQAINKIDSNENYNTSLGTRIAFYPIVYDILNQENNSLFFGIGMGDLKYELKDSIQRTKIINTIHEHVHSSYLTAYLNAGLIGFVLLILLIYHLFNIKINDKEMKFIQYLFLLNFSIGMIPDIILTQKIMMTYFALFVGIIMVQAKIEQEEELKRLKI